MCADRTGDPDRALFCCLCIGKSATGYRDAIHCEICEVRELLTPGAKLGIEFECTHGGHAVCKRCDAHDLWLERTEYRRAM